MIKKVSGHIEETCPNHVSIILTARDEAESVAIEFGHHAQDQIALWPWWKRRSWRFGCSNWKTFGSVHESRVSLALNHINNSGFASRGNTDLELRGVGSETFACRCAIDNLPLIVVVSLDAFTHVRFGRQRSAIHQNHFDFRHQPVATAAILVTVIDDTAFEDATCAKQCRRATLSDTELGGLRCEGDAILPDDLGQRACTVVTRHQSRTHRRPNGVRGYDPPVQP